MRGSIRTVLLAVVMALALLAGLARSAAASPSAQAFPQTKQPSSQRIEISGAITSAGQTVSISGSGAQSGMNAEIEMTVAIPNGAAIGLGDLTVSVKYVDGVAYLKLPSGAAGSEDTWYTLDMASAGAMLPGGNLLGGELPGMTPGGTAPGMSDLGSLPADLLGSFTITQDGKENIDNVPTTRYRVDVDLQKLYGALDSSLASSFGPDSKMMEYLWIGDGDMYLHKMEIVLNATVSSGSASEPVMLDLSYRFYDFDTPITITAPANAVPFNTGSLGLPTMPETSGGNVLPPIPTSETPTGSAPGMPRTGAGDSLLPLWPLLLGALLLGSGVLLRRRSAQPVYADR